ncbi:MAG: putative oxidoreductase [Frankiales bacterium]|nr:putative oxidoreductase [Frankiales bacterium]
MRRLGRTGLQVSAISLGAMNVGAGADEATSEQMLLTALDAGINLVDTADLYHHGESERILGEVLARNGRRDEVLIATKCGMPVGPGPNDRGASRRHVIASCEASLRRLGTDHIDLYQLHRPFFDVAPEETLSAFDQLVRDGKVRDIGSSTHPAWFLMECLAVSDRHGWPRYVTEQSPYNVLDRRAENELVPLCQRYGVAVMPWSPVAGGILAGRYTSVQDVPAGSRAARLPALRERLTGPSLAAATRLAELADQAGMHALELALVWLRDQPGVTSPVIGPRTPEQLALYLAAVERPPLEQALLDAIDEVVPPGGHVSDFYNSSRWMGGVGRSDALQR